MKVVFSIAKKKFVWIVALGLVMGCGKADLNKDLKPIDPNTPPPKPIGELQVDGAGGGASAPTPAVTE
jgi:hypothetical protein